MKLTVSITGKILLNLIIKYEVTYQFFKLFENKNLNIF